MRYNFYKKGNTVICVTKYNGKTIKGVAKCNPEYDEFDYETGKKIAQLRADMKVYEKKLKKVIAFREAAYAEVEQANANLAFAANKVDETMEELRKLGKQYDNMKKDLRF